MSVPQVPPRPGRSQHQHGSIGGMDVPRVPQRPNRRTSERSQSPPNHDHFPRSPFNEPHLGMTPLNKQPSRTLADSRNTSEVYLPKRPSSVNLPSVGQEGSEYAEIEQMNQEEVAVEDAEEADSKDANDPQEKRNVAGDLPLHAPKPSFTKDNAKQRVQAVTRTDSGQAAALGIGKAPTPSGSTDPDRASKRQVSFRPPSSASTERPNSSIQYEEEHGIPEIGQRVPMHPDAGDVQAPSSSPFPQSPVGIGFHNSGYSKPNKHHRRTPSGREVLPPGSYGLHGHGVPSADQFEQQWYAKHPDALEREEGEYGPGIGGNRAGWALSSDELNKLVRATSRPPRPDAGPRDEQSGYEASEEFSLASKFRPSSSQPTVKSPLRKSSFPVDPDAHPEIRRMSIHEASKASTEEAMESETEDDEPLALHHSKSRTNGHAEGFSGQPEDSAYGVPILASDEVARTPGAEFLQPAISPAQSRRGSAYYNAQDFEPHGLGLQKTSSRGGSAANSRPTSRPGSIYKIATHDEDRDMHTPLEDVDEYEPLFPDDERNKKHVTAAQRLKLREQMKRFPSQDIWEDTPHSLQLEATVDTPEPSPTVQAEGKFRPSAVFETPEQEARRKGEVSEKEKAKLLSKEERLAKSHFQPHIQEEMARPGMRQRFPSKDIWEDSPDSAGLTTTVGDSTTDEGLEAGAVVQTSGVPKKGIVAGNQSRDLATEGAPAMEKPTIPSRPNRSKREPPTGDLNQQPPIPARPPRRLHQVPPADAKVPLPPSKLAESSSPTDVQETSPIEGKKAPALPDRAKPQVPARPPKPAPESGEPTALSKVTSASSVGSEGNEKGVKSPPDALKPKPTVPARPAGSKIAALQGGFLADLNSRLKLGPQASKQQENQPTPEPEAEKTPLSDARKGRAKGPTKRKPAATTGDAASDHKTMPAKWSVSSPVTVWETDSQGNVTLVNDVAWSQQQAKPEASLESSAAKDEQIIDNKLASPETPATTVADLPTPGLEAERNPLSRAANSPNAGSPAQSQILTFAGGDEQTEDAALNAQTGSSQVAPSGQKDIQSAAEGHPREETDSAADSKAQVAGEEKTGTDGLGGQQTAE